jgi:hypothetical protein
MELMISMTKQLKNGTSEEVANCFLRSKKMLSEVLVAAGKNPVSINQIGRAGFYNDSAAVQLKANELQTQQMIKDSIAPREELEALPSSRCAQHATSLLSMAALKKTMMKIRDKPALMKILLKYDNVDISSGSGYTNSSMWNTLCDTRDKVRGGCWDEICASTDPGVQILVKYLKQQ